MAAAHPGLDWTPAPGLVVAVLLDLLLLRVLDDLRDLDHDRVHHPGRPLASGAVSVRDVAGLAVGCAALIPLLAGGGAASLLVAAQLGYAGCVFALDRLAGWPSGDAVFLGIVIALPVQLLLSGALYAGALDGAAPTVAGLAACAVPTLAVLHLEFARKTVRDGGSRTYVPALGFGGSAAVAVLAAAAAVAASVAVTASPLPLGALLLPAAALPMLPAGRWPLGVAAAFPLLLLGLLVLERLIPS